MFKKMRLFILFDMLLNCSFKMTANFTGIAGTNIKLVFNSFKIKNYSSCRDPIPNDLKSFLIYKFTCASCSSRDIGETCGHFKTRIEEHIKKDNKSHIFKHLHSIATCSYNSHRLI